MINAVNKGYQLFASRIDSALQQLLVSDVNRVLDECGSDETGLSTRYRPEIESIVALAYFLCSFGLLKPTPGMLLSNLSLEEETSRKTQIIPIFLLVMTYIFKRTELHSLTDDFARAPDGSWQRKFHHYLVLSRSVLRVVGVSNTLLFLWNGIYVNLFNRLSGYRMVASSHVVNGATLRRRGPEQSSALSFFKSRQIAWLVVMQLFASIAYVHASASAQSSASGQNRPWSITSLEQGFNWSALDLWRRRWTQRCVRSAHHIVSKIASVAMFWRSSYTTPINSMAEDPSRDLTAPTTPTGNNVNMRQMVTLSEEERAVCTLCRRCPMEHAQLSTCGHPYCYICLHLCQVRNAKWAKAAEEGAPTATASNGNLERGDSTPFLCPICDAVVI